MNIDTDYEEKRDLRMIVGFIVMTVFVVMMVSVTMAAFKYLNDGDYPSEYTHLYYESCNGESHGQEH